MKPVVAIFEFSTFGYPSREKKIEEALQLVRQVEGAKQGYWGFEVGEGNDGCIIQVWQSLLHHRELLAHTNFAGVRDALSSCFSKQPSISHVYFDEESTALSQSVLHILRVEAQSERYRRRLCDVMRQVVDRIGKTAFAGQSLESPSVYFVLIGATTVEREDQDGTSVRAVADLSEVADVKHRILWLKSVAGSEHELKRLAPGAEPQGMYSVPYTGKVPTPSSKTYSDNKKP